MYKELGISDTTVEFVQKLEKELTDIYQKID